MRAVAAALMGGGLFLVFLLLENRFSLRVRKHSLPRRLVVNLSLSLLVFISASLVIRPLGLFLVGWTSKEHLGLLHSGSLPAGVQTVLGFLLMDLTFYYWHLANHKIKFLWRFHNVHHIDPDLDVSTAFRFHFGEVLLSAIFRMVQVLLLGMSAWTYALYELIFQANTMWHHSNVRLPIQLERLLNKIMVTPRMHGIHHSDVRQETDSNFSVIFPWWDRLHGSLRLNVPHSLIAIGVPAYRLPGDNGILRLLIMPFRRQREYWKGPDGACLERIPAPPGKKDFLAT